MEVHRKNKICTYGVVWYVLESFSSSSVAEVMITLKEDRWLDAAFTNPNKISVLKDLETDNNNRIHPSININIR